MSFYVSVARPLLFSLDAEEAHELTLGALGRRIVPTALRTLFPPPPQDDRLRLEVCGLAFNNPLGVAAGLDKQGTALAAWDALGLGAAEVGTVTPQPQPGNPRPRLFRLPVDEALINRFGFNSDGAAAVRRNVGAGTRTRLRLGINLGRNKSTPNERAIDDYVAGVDAFLDAADYFVINVSSPNTVGLRDLQQHRELGALVAAVVARAGTRGTPVFVKLSPDMDDHDLLDSADAAATAGAAGFIATNTTVSRAGLASPPEVVSETGGLSGAPLRDRANAVCRLLHRHLSGRLPLVGVGGIDSPDAAWQRLRAGASLVQVYTGLVYQGPGLVTRILHGLTERMDRHGVRHLQEIIGSDAP
jgi:dihydroorotate dehydrogenase